LAAEAAKTFGAWGGRDVKLWLRGKGVVIGPPLVSSRFQDTLFFRRADADIWGNMNRRINFEDNLFMLNTRIRMIEHMLLLEADPELFLEKTLEDAEFIDAALGALGEQLSASIRYIEREEQYHNLAETERAFAEVLEGLKRDGGMAAQFPPAEEKLEVLRSRALERKKEAEGLSRAAAKAAAPEPLVSSDELSALLGE
jgi:hypothetical protein